jgi:hypothetical protein
VITHPRPRIGQTVGNWHYRALPEVVLLPACPFCGNRGRVVMPLRGLFVCGDCVATGRPEFAFCATYRDRPAPTVAASTDQESSHA